MIIDSRNGTDFREHPYLHPHIIPDSQNNITNSIVYPNIT